MRFLFHRRFTLLLAVQSCSSSMKSKNTSNTLVAGDTNYFLFIFSWKVIAVTPAYFYGSHYLS